MPGIIGQGPQGVNGAANVANVIAGDRRWEGHTHQEIYQWVKYGGAGPEVGEPAVQAWQKTAELIRHIDGGITSAMNGTTDHWNGAAAERTRGAMTPLGAWAAGAAEHASTTANAVAWQRNSASGLRTRIPEPVDGGWGTFFTDPGYAAQNVLHGFADVRAAEEAADNAARRAVELMRDYEHQSTDHKGRMVDVAAPPAVSVEVAPAAAPASGPGVAAPGLGGAPSLVPPGGAAPVGTADAGDALPPAGGVPAVSGAPGGAGAIPAGSSAPGGPGVGGHGGPSGGGPGAPAPVPTPLPGTAPPSATGVPTPPSAGPGTPLPPAGVAPPGSATGVPGPGGSSSRNQQGGGVVPPLPGVPTPPAPRPGDARIPTPGGLRPSVPTPPPRPSWRDVVTPHLGNPTGAADPNRPSGTGSGRAGSAPEGPARPGPFTERPAGGATEPTTRTGTPRPAANPVHGMYPPAAGAAGGAPDQERRRAPYLIDDSDAFADDRWFPPAVITPDS